MFVLRARYGHTFVHMLPSSMGTEHVPQRVSILGTPPRTKYEHSQAHCVENVSPSLPHHARLTCAHRLAWRRLRREREREQPLPLSGLVEPSMSLRQTPRAPRHRPITSPGGLVDALG